MTLMGLAYMLEDRTGLLTRTDFDDIYERLFLRIAQSPQQSADASFSMIYDMGRRSSASGSDERRHYHYQPSVVLQFGHDASLGTIHFAHASGSLSIPMSRYLRKSSFLGRSLSRKFKASDGQDYKWDYRVVQSQEWTCLSPDNHIIAHYDLKPADKLAYGSSGNLLTIREEFAHLAIEILASLTIMRHIAEHRL
ncbi:hypothetical protein JAAARDRAFT_40639 [Jaapia argillacea MUCL 33604]|uniref:DUF6593 domain-containing protein n=1 Tax=Jaapia argillacea MUCL 33604 TaxID=933084 RepID=A0A067PNX6_9AGAM|nr:hypothetical protein JAAARDRAFT_40639 [Jaapia argillacea MUCL 33604]